MNTIEQFNEHVMQTYGRIGLVMESGHGQTAVGEDGKEYIDFGSGIGTNSLGYCDEDWVNAICDQAHKIQHTSNYYYTKVQADFAKRLCEATGYDKMFFGNSGAEANECAIKLARKYSFDKYGKDAEKYHHYPCKQLPRQNALHSFCNRSGGFPQLLLPVRWWI